MLNLKTLLGVLAISVSAGSAQAALVDLADGTVRDTGTDLIWLQDWNVNGLGDYAAQTAWAEGLVFAGSGDWILPDRAQLIALATAYAPLNTSNTPFTNVIQNGGYWTSTAFTPGVSQWDFTPPFGFSGQTPVNLQLFAVAVRSSNVATQVPEPQTLALVLLALGATALARILRLRNRRAR